MLDDATQRGDFGTGHTDGFRIGVAVRGAKGEIVGALPALGPGGRWRAADFPTWTWKPWDEPIYHARMKPVFDSMKAVWGSGAGSLTGAPEQR